MSLPLTVTILNEACRLAPHLHKATIIRTNVATTIDGFRINFSFMDQSRHDSQMTFYAVDDPRPAITSNRTVEETIRQLRQYAITTWDEYPC